MKQQDGCLTAGFWLLALAFGLLVYLMEPSMHWYTYLFFALAFIAFTGFYYHARTGQPTRMVYSAVMLAVWAGLAVWTSDAHAAGPVQCANVRVVDGDSLKCAGLPELRLLGIDTPDKTYSAPCRGHYGDHVCDNALSAIATASMRRAVQLGPVTFIPVTTDHYGRTVAEVFAGSTDLQCYQLKAGVARYLRRYDNGRRIHQQCPALAN